MPDDRIGIYPSADTLGYCCCHYTGKEQPNTHAHTYEDIHTTKIQKIRKNRENGRGKKRRVEEGKKERKEPKKKGKRREGENKKKKKEERQRDNKEGGLGG